MNLGLNFLFDGREDVPELERMDFTSRDGYFKGENKEIISEE